MKSKAEKSVRDGSKKIICKVNKTCVDKAKISMQNLWK